MNKVNNLKMSISDEVGWFILENENMDTRIFTNLINQLCEIMSSLYTGRDTIKGRNKETYIKRQINTNGELALKVMQEKVPNIIKGLVQMPSQEIQVNLTGITPQKEIVTRIISRPFNESKVTELIPCYHGLKNNQEQNKTTKR